MTPDDIARLITEDPDIILEQYYIKKRGKKSGPFTLDQLQTMVKRGQLARIHSISADGQNWNAASEVPELFQQRQPQQRQPQQRQPQQRQPQQRQPRQQKQPRRAAHRYSDEFLQQMRERQKQSKLWVNSKGKRISPEDFAVRNEFIKRAKSGEHFTHPSYGESVIFKVADNGQLFDTTTRRYLQGSLEQFADTVTARKNVTWVPRR